MTMAMTTTTIMNAPTTPSVVRTLRDDELDGVAGGLGIVGGMWGAALGGISAGVGYSMSTIGVGGFSWRTFAGEVATTSLNGFLIGSGASLIRASFLGVTKGAHVLGVSVAGAGILMQGAPMIQSQGGGSSTE